MRAHQLIQELKLLPHPEGGYYREIFRSQTLISAPQGERNALTLIYFLLKEGEVSKFHQVLSDEAWNFIEGAPLRLVSVSADFHRNEEYTLASSAPGSVPLAIIPAEDWQAAECLGDYSLVSCTVGPGFDFADFRLLRNSPGVSSRMTVQYPALKKFY